jgi:hypothetical protein
MSVTRIRSWEVLVNKCRYVLVVWIGNPVSFSVLRAGARETGFPQVPGERIAESGFSFRPIVGATARKGITDSPPLG